MACVAEKPGSTKGHVAWDDTGLPHPASLLVLTITLLAAVIALAPRPSLAQEKKPHLPYVTIDQPQFTGAAEATFLNPGDKLIGVTDGKTPKAYPAAILAQHGVVQDQMADGPIAITW